jgi:hypothetical protein
VSAIEFVANSGQLPSFEFAHAQAASAFGRADQCGIHQLEHGALAEGMRNHFGTSPLLAEQPLEQVGGMDRTPVREREAQMGNAGCAAPLGRYHVIAQRPRKRRRGVLVAGRAP